MPQYIAVVRKAEGTDYWIDIPDIPGCVSRGDTPEAARANFREALEIHLQDRNTLPPPRTRAELTADDLEDSVETFAVEL